MPRDDFDNSVALPVEAMSKVAFSHWIAEVHAEVSNHVNSGIGKPARTMIRLSTSSFIGAGTLLRKLAILEASRGDGKFTEEVQSDILMLLRDEYEFTRKLFMFSLINAKSGLVDAANVINTEDGLLNKKEMKRFEASQASGSRKSHGNGSNFQKSEKSEIVSLLKDLVSKDSNRSKGADRPRSICFNCQKPGHYANVCPRKFKNKVSSKRKRRARVIESSESDSD